MADVAWTSEPNDNWIRGRGEPGRKYWKKMKKKKQKDQQDKPEGNE